VAVVAVLGITVLAKAPVSPLPAVVKLPSTPLLVLKTPVLEVRTTVAEVTAVAVVSGTSPMVAVVVRPRCEDL
jgi:hypothetical protein